MDTTEGNHPLEPFKVLHLHDNVNGYVGYTVLVSPDVADLFEVPKIIAEALKMRIDRYAPTKPLH